MGEIKYKITADNSNFKNAMKENVDLTNALGSTIGGLKGQIAALVGTYVSFDFLKGSAKAFMDSETQISNLSNAVSGNGGLKSDFDALSKQADDLQKIGIFDDEQIRGAEALGLQFNLTSQEMQKMLPTVLDWSARMGMAPAEAIGHISKAITGHDKLLTKLGFAYDKNATSAQNLVTIQELLARKFAGSNKEMAEMTGEGQIANLRNQFNELEEQVGEGLLRAFGAIRPSLIEFIDWAKGAVAWVTQNWTAIKRLGEIVVLAFAAFKAWNAVLVINEALIGVKMVFALVNATSGIAAMTVSQYALNLAVSLFPGAVLITLLGVLIQKIITFKTEAELLNDALKQTGDKAFQGEIDQVNMLAGAYEKYGASKADAMKKAISSEKASILADKKELEERFQVNKDFAVYQLGSADLTARMKALSSLSNQAGKPIPRPEPPSKKETVRENITINITKLVETIELRTTTLKEGTDDIKKIVAQSLQEAVYGVKYAGK
jgi:hypothetical protein